jgi:hypothetical protein
MGPALNGYRTRTTKTAAAVHFAHRSCRLMIRTVSQTANAAMATPNAPTIVLPIPEFYLDGWMAGIRGGLVALKQMNSRLNGNGWYFPSATILWSATSSVLLFFSRMCHANDSHLVAWILSTRGFLFLHLLLEIGDGKPKVQLTKSGFESNNQRVDCVCRRTGLAVRPSRLFANGRTVPRHLWPAPENAARRGVDAQPGPSEAFRLRSRT